MPTPQPINHRQPDQQFQQLASEFLGALVDRLAADFLERVEQRAEQLASERIGQRAAVDTKTAAERLGISQRSVERHVASGKLPSLRIGRKRVISVQTLNRILADSEMMRELVAEPEPRPIRRRR